MVMAFKTFTGRSASVRRTADDSGKPKGKEWRQANGWFLAVLVLLALAGCTAVIKDGEYSLDYTILNVTGGGPASMSEGGSSESYHYSLIFAFQNAKYEIKYASERIVPRHEPLVYEHEAFEGFPLSGSGKLDVDVRLISEGVYELSYNGVVFPIDKVDGSYSIIEKTCIDGNKNTLGTGPYFYAYQCVLSSLGCFEEGHPRNCFERAIGCKTLRECQQERESIDRPHPKTFEECFETGRRYHFIYWPITFSSKSECLSEATNPAYCDDFETQARIGCISEIAVNTNNASLCDELDMKYVEDWKNSIPWKTDISRDNCIIAVASDNNQPELCEKVQNQTKCLSYVEFDSRPCPSPPFC